MSPNFRIADALFILKLIVVAVIAMTGRSSKTAEESVKGLPNTVKVRIYAVIKSPIKTTSHALCSAWNLSLFEKTIARITAIILSIPPTTAPRRKKFTEKSAPPKSCITITPLEFFC